MKSLHENVMPGKIIQNLFLFYFFIKLNFAKKESNGLFHSIKMKKVCQHNLKCHL